MPQQDVCGNESMCRASWAKRAIWPAMPRQLLSKSRLKSSCVPIATDQYFAAGTGGGGGGGSPGRGGGGGGGASNRSQQYDQPPETRLTPPISVFSQS